MLETLVGAVVEIVAEPKELTVRESARVVSRSAGYDRAEWKCFEEIIWRESRWDPAAENGKHYGLGQMADAKYYLEGKPKKQIKKIIEYIEHRYKTACNALRFHDRNGWF